MIKPYATLQHWLNGESLYCNPSSAGKQQLLCPWDVPSTTECKYNCDKVTVQTWISRGREKAIVNIFHFNIVSRLPQSSLMSTNWSLCKTTIMLENSGKNIDVATSYLLSKIPRKAKNLWIIQKKDFPKFIRNFMMSLLLAIQKVVRTNCYWS